MGAVSSTAAGPSLPIEGFSESGFALLPGYLSPGQLRRAQRAADLAVAHPSGITCERPNNSLVPLRWDDDLVDVMVMSISRVSEAVQARDLRWISGYVSSKDPHSPPLWWHQDWWAWDHDASFRPDAPQVALLCYLVDTTIRTGALRVLPGTHRGSVPLHALLPEAHSSDSAILDPDCPAMADQPGQVSLEMRAGDALVTDYRLLHGTHAHEGDHRRDCVLLSFAPAWSALPEEIRAHLIGHPALPGAGEEVPEGPMSALLPEHQGPTEDLALNRNAPANWRI
jgi:hypothetical protein